MAGLPEPKVVSNLKNRGKQIDAAVDAAVAPAEKKPTPEVKMEKPITADEAAIKAAKYAKDRADFDAAAKKGMVKP